MTLVKNLIGLKSSTKGDFGIEIEVEGPHLYDDYRNIKSLPEPWVAVEDGSLQRGLEFITNGPVEKKSLDKVLQTLYNTLIENKIRYNSSDRTGIHLHLNVQDLSLKQLMNFLTYYYVIEEALVDTCGENRIGNHFCFRAIDAEYLMSVLNTAVTSRTIVFLNESEIRYAALNLNALFKFGSVEFRAIQTTNKFEHVILPVADVLYQLREKAKEVESPREIIENFSDMGYVDFIRNVMGDTFNVIENVEQLEVKLKRGMRLIQPISYTFTDWK